MITGTMTEEVVPPMTAVLHANPVLATKITGTMMMIGYDIEVDVFRK
jgi:hypothetical protein